MWPAFPASDYYGLSAPCRRHQSATDLPTAPGLAARDPAGPSAGFPRSLLTVRRDRHPAMPLHHRHDYAAGLHHGLPGRRHSPNRKFPARPLDSPAEAERRAVGTGARCDPAHVRQVPGWWVRLRGVQTLVPHVCLSVLLAEPAPSGSTGTPRLVRAAVHPHPRPGDRAALSFTVLLRQHGGGGLSPPLGSTAPRGARSPRPRVGRVPTARSCGSPGPAASAPSGR